MSKTKRPDLGLYRHFKGEYYLLESIVYDCTKDEFMCRYCNVLKTHLGWFVRPVDEWESEITERGVVADRLDNVTGQKHRFEKVISLTDTLKNHSTQELIDELSLRKDSPYQSADVAGLNSMVFCTDYCIGEKIKPSELKPQRPYGVFVHVAFNTEEEMRDFNSRCDSNRLSLFKRTFIEID